MNKKSLHYILALVLAGSFFGLTFEYLRFVRESRKYALYETQVETGLLAQMAKNSLEKQDQKEFEDFCRNSFRYRPIGDRNRIHPMLRPRKEGIFMPPDSIGLQTRITLLDDKGNVLFDSWKNGDQMENHAARPEFREIMKKESEYRSFFAFERYSTTMEQKMFFCITKFQVNGKTFLLRTGNTIHALRFAGFSEWKEFGKTFLFFSVVLIIAGYFILARFRFYRAGLLELEKEIERKDSIPFGSGSEDPRFQGVFRSVDQTIQAIKGGINDNREQLVMEKMIRNRIFHSLAEGVVLLDEEGNILEINENACRILETRRSKATGISIFSIWRDPQFEELFWSRKTVPNPDSSEETGMEFAVGNRRIDVRFRSIRQSPDSDAVLLLMYDLTRVHKLENYRKDFIANVSHEIKTPLTVIMGSVEALQDGALEDKNLKNKFLETLLLHTKRLYALVQDVLSLSNLDSEPDPALQNFEIFSVREALDPAVACCSDAAREKGIPIEIQDDSECDEIKLDPSLMEQAFVNLIENAVKYTDLPESPENAEDPQRGKILIQLINPKKDRLEIRIIDSGPGIPLEHQKRIFERFYRVDKSRNAKTGGTGLGLAIVKHIVQLHGGSVSVKNNPEQGCTFTLSFPVAD
ncbi:MAG: ATP-binding protein [Planctomycetia bacterium]|nr:ATP-binding protein [Planctomycetia bacterium]